MAILPRGLCILLALGLVLSRPSAANRSESPDVSDWWDAEAFAGIQEKARRLHAAGALAELESLYSDAERYAQSSGNLAARISILTALGNTRTLAYRYADALDAYLQSMELAESSGNWLAYGAAATNLANIYLLLGDADAARRVADRGEEAVHQLQAPPYYEAQLLGQRARLRASTGNANGPMFYAAIDAARRQLDFTTEAELWDLLGQYLLEQGDLGGAESATIEGFRIRRLLSPQTLPLSYLRLGGVRFAQARENSSRTGEYLRNAELFTEIGLDYARASGQEFELGDLLLQRGLIRRAQGRIEEALADLDRRLDIGRRWRLTVAPSARSLLTAANAKADQRAFRSFVEIAANVALAQGDRRWRVESFLAAEVDRAASLRQSRELSAIWREMLPEKYWVTLARIRAAQGQGAPAADIDRLFLELTEMEARTGRRYSAPGYENFRSEASLILLQNGLSESELLVSFHLGAEESYLWAVTRNNLSLYRIPAARNVQTEVQRFRNALLGQQADVRQLGYRMYRSLFGQLAPMEASKPDWLLSLEGALFELPFAALVTGGFEDVPADRTVNGTPETTNPGIAIGIGTEMTEHMETGIPMGWEAGREAGREPEKAAFLIEQHSLRIVPGALMALSRPAASQDRFLGVADPIYNTADSRWIGTGSSAKMLLARLGNPAGESLGQLNRLAASGTEVRQSALAWMVSSGSAAQNTWLLEGTTTLEGATATRESFLNAVQEARPSTIHLATHVLHQPKHPDQALIAFSLDSQGRPETISTTEIGMLHIPGALVVMTGCETATGEFYPGAGLVGLTRAWLVAGANAVVATTWPVADAPGDLLPGFYRNLKGATPAQALQQSQIEMIHSENWQADPAYWAAYQVTGGAQ